MTSCPLLRAHPRHACLYSQQNGDELLSFYVQCELYTDIEEPEERYRAAFHIYNRQASPQTSPVTRARVFGRVVRVAAYWLRYRRYLLPSTTQGGSMDYYAGQVSSIAVSSYPNPV